MQTATHKRGLWRILGWSLAGLVAVLAVATLVWFTIALGESRISGSRAPYLQLAGVDTITLRWGTEQETADTVYYGRAPDQLDRQVHEPRPTLNHRATLTGLEADTHYYYRIQHAGQWRTAEPQWFVTAPAVGESRPLRAWILGDPGKYAAKIPVRDAALAWLTANRRVDLPYLDLLLTTGDQAYPNASTAQLDRGFFMPYRNVLQNIPVWPVLGNHDARRWAHYRLFDSPQQGELGGVASHDKGYFAFDYAQTHFVILDSHDADTTAGAPMLRWLEQDLAQTRQPWIIVLFHQPPYTKGTHDSDNPRDSRGRMQRTRENIAPILDRHGVDLVMSGHSHVYERSHLIHCHYGTSDSFVDWMIEDAGQPQADLLTYTKANAESRIYSGTMYMVLGSSGEGNRGPFGHPALPVHSEEPGSLVLDIVGDTLTARYITASGEIDDEFRIIKKEQEGTQPVRQTCQK